MLGTSEWYIFRTTSRQLWETPSVKLGQVDTFFGLRDGRGKALVYELVRRYRR